MYMLFIFDMGGVVTTTFQMDLIYNKLNLTKEQFKEICRMNGTDLLRDFELGNISSLDFWNDFNIRVGNIQRSEIDGISKINSQIIHCTPEILSNIPEIKYDLFRLFFHPELKTGTVDLIEKLKKNHRVVCGTNTNQSHWENHLERGDYSYFHQTYASNKIGVTKPNPDFFKIILDAEGFEPSQAFFTDDKQENIDAALSVGINAQLFTSPEELSALWKKFC